jgi:hypothetical protein
MGGTQSLINPALDAGGSGPETQPQQPASVPAPDPHARLKSMIAGMFMGMGAAGKAIATGGREGGVSEVLQEQHQQKELEMQQEAQQRAQAESESRIKWQNAQTNAATAQTQIQLHNAPLEHQRLVLENQASVVKMLTDIGVPSAMIVPILEGQSTDEHMQALNTKTGGDFVNNAIVPVHDEKFGGNGNSYGFDFSKLHSTMVPIEKAGPMLATLQNTIDMARGELGADDPNVKVAQGKLDLFKSGGSASAADLLSLNQMVQAQLLGRVQAQQQVTKFKTEQAELKQKQQETDPLFKLENDPSQMQGEKASSAMAMLQSKLTDPNLSAADKPRVQRLLAQAKQAQKNYLSTESAKAQMEQSAREGDPVAAGKLLAQGLIAPSQIPGRSSFRVKAIEAASKIDPNFNAAKAETQYQYAHNVQTQNTLNMISAMEEKGGSIDIAEKAAQNLPALDSKILNKVFNATETQFGSANITNFHTAMLGLADEYSKVMGGGVSSDTGRQQALDILKDSYSKGQLAGAISIMKQDITARKRAMVRDNPTLKALYPESQGNGAFDPRKDFKPIQ